MWKNFKIRISKRWQVWLRGLLTSAIGGAAGSAGALLGNYASTGQLPTFKAVGVSALFGAATAVFFHLKQFPWPPEEEPTTGGVK